ncbi:MAG TPA: Nramp family divalent metal transporter [Dehalococcoidia bacterium]|nr:Nramp family divalent metal transporter [Dehalococcoidia bacterium]
MISPPPTGRLERLRRKARYLLSLPGPGIVTGAADDDPSGIATYSLAGARLGYGLLWTSLFTLPLNAAVQNMCARIGLLSGGGLAAALRRRYSRRVLLTLVSLLFAANVANLGADLAAVAAGVDMLTGLPEQGVIVPIGIAIALTEIMIPYRIFATYLKILTLVLFAYVIDVFFTQPDWSEAIKRTFIPHIELNAEFVSTLVAVFGTTISPYLFFWQTSEEVEELHHYHKERGTEPDVRRAQMDVNAGMLLCHVVVYFIILTTAATFFPSGVREISTAREAAEALRPLAGNKATVLFAVGFIGTGLLTIPILAGSAAYAVAEVFDWKEGLEEKPRQAPQFYLVIAIATVIGLVIAATGIGAIRALFIAAIINGVTAPLLIFAIIAVSNDSEVVGAHRNSALSNALGYATVVVMSLAAIAMFATFALSV